MKWHLLTVGVMALALSACGNEGNPNGQPYATDPGGTIAVQPQTVGTVSYRPYGKVAPFEDMKTGIAPTPNAMPAPPPQ